MSKYLTFILVITLCAFCSSLKAESKPRVIATTDGEIDDECSMVRFLLYANELDIEGIVTSSSQYHSHGHNWAGDDWVKPYLKAYAKVYPNLIKHDSDYPTPGYLQQRTRLGNVKAEGTMDKVTPGSKLIVDVLLDESDDRPVWLQAWGGPNTIARALKTIEEKHPEKMEYIANKIRLFFIWEQDSTYQSYIRSHWGKYNILTIISDQFEAIAYRWKRAQPEKMHKYLAGDWMREHILQEHGPLCSLYQAHTGNNESFDKGAFRSEGDSPAFLHVIPNGLRSTESPGYGGWGGRYVKVHNNTWLDPVPVEGYEYPEGRWYAKTAWGHNSLRRGASTETDKVNKEYFKPMWRWTDAIQNDFAARADWCVKSYSDANHHPIVSLNHDQDLKVQAGSTVKLSAKGYDPDGGELIYKWWQYNEAGTYEKSIQIKDSNQQDASFTVPDDSKPGDKIHIICEVKDQNSPKLTSYQRLIITIRS